MAASRTEPGGPAHAQATFALNDIAETADLHELRPLVEQRLRIDRLMSPILIRIAKRIAARQVERERHKGG